MSEVHKGLVAVLFANLLWGLFPLYWMLLSDVPPLEVFAHRTFWSLFSLAAILAYQRRLADLLAVFREPQTRWRTIAAAFAISGNWFLFIYAVQTGAVLESSIGYYIFPILAVCLGVVFFKERLSVAQWLSVVLAAMAVVTLTVGLGVTPWLSLALAVCFAIYGAFKRGTSAGPFLSVAAEVVVIGPLSLIWILGVHFLGWTDFTGQAGGFFGSDWKTTALMIFSGIVTAVPLMLFAYGARRVTYSTIGLMQYINPSMQFVLAVLIFGQTITAAHAVALPMIWLALTIYSVATFRKDLRARRVDCL